MRRQFQLCIVTLDKVIVLVPFQRSDGWLHYDAHFIMIIFGYDPNCHYNYLFVVIFVILNICLKSSSFPCIERERLFAINQTTKFVPQNIIFHNYLNLSRIIVFTCTPSVCEGYHI